MKIEFRLASFYARELSPDETVVLSEADGWIKLNSGDFRTGNIDRVVPFAEYCVDEARRRVDVYVAKRTLAIAPSLAVTTGIEIPVPAGMAYRGYQAAGVEFMRRRHSSLNADVPRLGKTIQTLGVANTYGRVLKILVVGPANAKSNWCREARKWLVHQGTIEYAEGDNCPASDFLSINYELLVRHADFLRSVAWDIVVFDEAHALKNKDSKRTLVCLGKGKDKGLQAKLHRIFLTGTPIFVRPVDLWNMIQVCDPHDLGRSWWAFVHRYCDAKRNGFALDTSGSSREEELQFKMRSNFMVRREKKDIGAELKPTRQTIVLPKTGLAKLVKAEKNAVQKNLSILFSLLENRLSDVETDQMLEAFTNLGDFIPGPVATARRELAVAMVPMAIDAIKEIMWAEKKLVVFVHHVEVAQQLKAAFPDFAMIIGGLTTKQRDVERERFQNDPDCPGIIGNITSMGVAIELSAADTVVFVEQSWIPAEMDQAEERIWLPSKTMPMTIIKLVVEDSLQMALAAVVEARQASIERTMNARLLDGVVIQNDM